MGKQGKKTDIPSSRMFLWSIERPKRDVRSAGPAVRIQTESTPKLVAGLADAFEVFPRREAPHHHAGRITADSGPSVYISSKPSISTRPASKHFNYLCHTSPLSRTHRFLPSSCFSLLSEWLSGRRQPFAICSLRNLRIDFGISI